MNGIPSKSFTAEAYSGLCEVLALSIVDPCVESLFHSMLRLTGPDILQLVWDDRFPPRASPLRKFKGGLFSRGGPKIL